MVTSYSAILSVQPYLETQSERHMIFQVLLYDPVTFWASCIDLIFYSLLHTLNSLWHYGLSYCANKIWVRIISLLWYFKDIRDIVFKIENTRQRMLVSLNKWTIENEQYRMVCHIESSKHGAIALLWFFRDLNFLNIVSKSGQKQLNDWLDPHNSYLHPQVCNEDLHGSLQKHHPEGIVEWLSTPFFYWLQECLLTHSDHHPDTATVDQQQRGAWWTSFSHLLKLLRRSLPSHTCTFLSWTGRWRSKARLLLSLYQFGINLFLAASAFSKSFDFVNAVT